MNILSLQMASSLGLKPHEYSGDIGVSGKALKLDFRVKGRGGWIDCYFTCAKGTGQKFKLPVFMNSQGVFSPSNSLTNFEGENLEGKVFVISADVIDGRSVWTKALKIM
jgi:hypothetical protein